VVCALWAVCAGGLNVERGVGPPDRWSMSSIDQAVSAAQVSSEFSMRVAKKAQDASKQQGESAIALLESAQKTAETAQAVGRDGRVDVAA